MACGFHRLGGKKRDILHDSVAEAHNADQTYRDVPGHVWNSLGSRRALILTVLEQDTEPQIGPIAVFRKHECT